MSEIHEFMKKRPGLIWYVRDIDNLDDRSIVEHVLNYGNWDDVQEMIRIMGMERVAEVFRTWAFVPRTNYFPEITNYFQLYFNKHATAA
jgi:hypothetical protein